jgi:hypothetical protein
VNFLFDGCDPDEIGLACRDSGNNCSLGDAFEAFPVSSRSRGVLVWIDALHAGLDDVALSDVSIARDELRDPSMIFILFVSPK